MPSLASNCLRDAQGRRYARPTVTDLLRRLDLRGVPDATALLPPLGGPDDGPVEAVRTILDNVRRRGDAALPS